jgi:hypothetical protein
MMCKNKFINQDLTGFIYLTSSSQESLIEHFGFQQYGCARIRHFFTNHGGMLLRMRFNFNLAAYKALHIINGKYYSNLRSLLLSNFLPYPAEVLRCKAQVRSDIVLRYLLNHIRVNGRKITILLFMGSCNDLLSLFLHTAKHLLDD